MSNKIQVVAVTVEELKDLIATEVNRIHQFYTEKGMEGIAAIRDELYMINEWWSLEDTARYFGVTPDTVRKVYVNQGLKCSKPGQYLRFKRDDIYQWQEENRVKKAA